MKVDVCHHVAQSRNIVVWAYRNVLAASLIFVFPPVASGRQGICLDVESDFLLQVGNEPVYHGPENPCLAAI